MGYSHTIRTILPLLSDKKTHNRDSVCRTETWDGLILHISYLWEELRIKPLFYRCLVDISHDLYIFEGNVRFSFCI